jgi:hypothetical protein
MGVRDEAGAGALHQIGLIAEKGDSTRMRFFFARNRVNGDLTPIMGSFELLIIHTESLVSR